MKNEQRGFTIVEVMVAVAISTMIIFGIFGIFQAGSEQTQFSQTKMTLEDSAREALYKMTQEIRQSAPSRITVGGSGDSLQIQVPDPSSLVQGDYTVDWDSAHTIQYALGGTGNSQLLRTDTATNLTSVIANDVTDIQFVGNGSQPDIVTITIDVQRELQSGRMGSDGNFRKVPESPLQMTAQAEVRNL